MGDAIGILNYFKEWRVVKNNYIDLTKILVVDILFFITTILFVYLANKIDLIKISNIEGVLIIGVYVLVLITIYSIYKIITLKTITKSIKLERINLNLISKFLGLNICIFIILGLIFMLMRTIVMSVVSEYSYAIYIIINIIFAIFAFTYIHTTHAIFSSDPRNNTLKIIGSSLYPSLKVHTHKEIYFGALIILIYFGVTYLVSWSLGIIPISPPISAIEISQSIMGGINLVIIYILYTATRYITIKRNA